MSVPSIPVMVISDSKPPFILNVIVPLEYEPLVMKGKSTGDVPIVPVPANAMSHALL